MSFTAASGPSPCRLRSTATAPCSESMHCAETSESSQNAASRRAEVRRVMIAAIFARLPSSPCSSSSKSREVSAASTTPPASVSDAVSDVSASGLDCSSRSAGAESCLAASASWNSRSKPAMAASSSSSLKCMPSALDSSGFSGVKPSESLGLSLITGNPSCWGCRGRADPVRRRSAARGQAP